MLKTAVWDLALHDTTFLQPSFLQLSQIQCHTQDHERDDDGLNISIKMKAF